MTFSRKQPAVFVRQPLGPVVREAVALLRATLPSGVSITLRGDDTPADVLADATQVHQVVMNLGTNAWQAMGQRTGRIDVTLEPVDGERIRLSVQDNGSGMDAATQARIFEPFFTTKPDGEGTGLGLSVVQRIVNAHQGEISVTSQPGMGCRFDIVLPLAQEAAEGQAQAAPPPAQGELPADALPMPELLPPPPAIPEPAPGNGDASRRHIVYVDDYEAMVAMVMAVLEAHGFRVSGFDSSPRALDFLRRHAHEVDMLITDFNMPEMSGLDLAREVKAVRPAMPVMVASGHLSADLRAGAAQAGVDCLFDKPAGIDEMCRRIDELLAAA
jgi:CheY-like chemotaxis protein